MFVKKHIYIYGNSNSSEMLLLFFSFFLKFDEINMASD